MKTLAKYTAPRNNGTMISGTRTSFVALFVLLFTFMIPAKAGVSSASFNSGNCLQFNGTNTAVTFPSNKQNLFLGSEMTITAWVKWSNKTTAGASAGIVCLNNNNGTNGDMGQFWLQHSSNNSLFEFALQNTSSLRATVQSTTSPSVGTWYFVAGVYDGSFIYIYVNGVLEAKTAFTGTINNYQGNFQLVFGRWANSIDNYRQFNGHIDEVSIWTSALTKTQLRNMMCKKLAGTETGLTGYWRMNESSGSTVTDLTSNQRNGTAANTTIAFSGAPVGDDCNYTYGGTSVSVKDPIYGDSILVNNLSATPAGIFVYRIDTLPNTQTFPSIFTGLSPLHYYGVFIVNANGETYTVSYCYKGHPGITNSAFLGMATRADNSVLAWTDLLPTHNVTNSILSKSAQTGRNEYILASKNIANPLPVNFISFTATQEENRLHIKWTTATETNNDFFTVERSTDGLIFETLTQVKGAGNSVEKLNYDVFDNSPLQGNGYYRIKQTDYNGKSKYSNLISVNFSKNTESSMQVFYNSGLVVKMVGFDNQKVEIKMYDLYGNMLYTKAFIKDNTIEHFLTGVTPTEGIYIVTLATDKKTYSQKVCIR